jgi:transposase
MGFLRFCGLGFGSKKEGTQMQNNTKATRRYDSDFKRDAVALVQSGRSINEVARDLGVSGWSLRHWIRLDKRGEGLKEPATLAGETPEQRELRRLRQENEYLRRQRDILKKALGILSAEMPPNALP